jgi:hypothetical protein
LATRLSVWIASSAEGIANCTTLGLFVLDTYDLWSLPWYWKLQCLCG